jgi:DNA polymerase-3 subunit gamma/tau
VPAVDCLERLIAKRFHAYLSTGPSGVGKTTLARLTAFALGCDNNPLSLTEADAATYTGIDAMRAITGRLQYVPFGDNPNRAIIIDECHCLSKPAWSSLLKRIEEPPKDTTWLFCTTEPSAVPATIKTRCAIIKLGRVGDAELRVLIDRVCASERLDLTDGERQQIVKDAMGRPRVALVQLQLHGHPLAPPPIPEPTGAEPDVERPRLARPRLKQPARRRFGARQTCD